MPAPHVNFFSGLPNRYVTASFQEFRISFFSASNSSFEMMPFSNSDFNSMSLLAFFKMGVCAVLIGTLSNDVPFFRLKILTITIISAMGSASTNRDRHAHASPWSDFASVCPIILKIDQKVPGAHWSILNQEPGVETPGYSYWTLRIRRESSTQVSQHPWSFKAMKAALYESRIRKLRRFWLYNIFFISEFSKMWRIWLLKKTRIFS